jgi:hypothetical protein
LILVAAAIAASEMPRLFRQSTGSDFMKTLMHV